MSYFQKSNHLLITPVLLLIEMLSFSIRPVEAQTARQYLTKGIQFYENADFEASITNLKQAIQGNLAAQFKVQTHQYLAFSYIALNKKDEARQEYEKLLKIDPEYEIPLSFSPKLRTLFDEVKKTLIAVDKIPPTIIHTPPAKVQAGENCLIQAEVKDNVQVTTVTLYYRPKGETVFKSQNLVASSVDQFQTKIGIPPTGIEYYLQATDAQKNLGFWKDAKEPQHLFAATVTAASPQDPTQSEVIDNNVNDKIQPGFTQSSIPGVKRRRQIELNGGLAFPTGGEGDLIYFAKFSIGYNLNANYVMFLKPNIGLLFGFGFNHFPGKPGIVSSNQWGYYDKWEEEADLLYILEFCLGIRYYITPIEARTKFFLFGMGTFSYGAIEYKIINYSVGNVRSDNGSIEINDGGMVLGTGIEIGTAQSIKIVFQGSVRYIASTGVLAGLTAGIGF